VRALRFTLVVTALVAAGGFVASPRAAAPAAFRVIVNPANPTTIVERRFVAEAFLKKTTRWPDGSLIRPVDEGVDSAVRARFSDEILGRSTAAVKSYWQQLVFAGRALPPPELDSDEDVIRYVLKSAGAVGYVSGTANVEHVRTLVVK
jgi:ABC-type phosphate transport system substrate-binding protein